MKAQLLFFALFVLLAGCKQASQKESDQQVLDELERLADELDFFRLRETLESQKNRLSEDHTLYYRAIVDNAFNDPEESNKGITALLNRPDIALSDTLLKDLYFIKLQNHTNLYEYAEAEKTNAFIQEYYRSLLDSSELADLQNTGKIWSALKHTPRQEIVRNKDFTIQMQRDKAELFNIDVVFDTATVNMVFDTGANFSVIGRSYVDSLGLELIEADFHVGALTGARVNSDLAVAQSLDIGGLTFKNVVFLVFDDKDLSIPQIDYQVKGIIGFPVIEAMEEIRISKDNRLFIPREPASYAFNNLTLDGFMPVVAGEYRGDTLRFHFDTGARYTLLFPLFFRKYKDEIEKNNKKTVFKSWGAGGMKEFQGYMMNDIHLKIGNSTAGLDSLRLHIEDIGGEENHFHGNLGQDYIKQFDEMIISFKYSSVSFN